VYKIIGKHGKGQPEWKPVCELVAPKCFPFLIFPQTWEKVAEGAE